MPAPDAIRRLVENFDRNRDTYMSGSYNETQVRVDFIDPMFAALGWDVHNKSGHAEAYRDVIHEFSIKMGATTKAPDYCFRIGQTPKFFLEAKKPSVLLKDSKDAALQLRRYAWSAKLPVSILTDFDEFAVYDCRVKPDKSDSSSAARTEYFTYDKYEEKWDEIASVFSKEAILLGSFDKYVESKKKKRGTAEVDEAFLKEIERWRDLLARNINLRNRDKGLAPHELNEAVQKTIDRIIFLRICEDRGIEPYAQLLGLTSGDRVYDRLQVLFHRADERYNSGLFHFRHEKERGTPDTWTLKLEIDDKPLKEILKHLYYPDSPYEFSVLPADILGQVYEQFLGKVITPKGLKVTIEDKPDVKKAGGVYYTPTYIVDYIVKQTVGKLLEGKSPEEVAGKNRAKDAHPLRALDPACGSGTFLIGTYQELLNWYLAQYTMSPEEIDRHLKGKTPRLREAGRGKDYRLSTQERKRILLDHIYGVDIDPQAVEVTKLSLLLKVLEGENDNTLNVNLQLFHERALPDLDNNIKCGNSLIGPDFYDDPENATLPDGDRRRINAFDWKAEFENVFAGENPGFDAVIGNPPWGAELTEREKKFLRQRHARIVKRMIDSFMYFIDKGTSLVCPNGRLGMIVPDVLLYQGDNEPLRRYLTENFAIETIVNGGNVFHGVTRPTCLFTIHNSGTEGIGTSVADMATIESLEKPSYIQSDSSFSTVKQSLFSEIPGCLFITRNFEAYGVLVDLLKKVPTRLREFVDDDGIQRGVSPDLKDAFIVSKADISKYKLELSHLRPVLTGGREVRRYSVDHDQRFVIYTTRDTDFATIPNICRFIDSFADAITCKEVQQGKHPLYALHRSRDEQIFQKTKKILGVITQDRPVLAIDDHKMFATDGIYLFAVRPEFSSECVLAVLNSTLSTFLYRLLAMEEGRVLAQVKPTVLSLLPIPTPPRDGLLTEQIASTCNSMTKSIGLLDRAKTPHDRTLIEREIERTDREIDRLVYELYGLTEAEIKIVEEATR